MPWKVSCICIWSQIRCILHLFSWTVSTLKYNVPGQPFDGLFKFTILIEPSTNILKRTAYHQCPFHQIYKQNVRLVDCMILYIQSAVRNKWSERYVFSGCNLQIDVPRAVNVCFCFCVRCDTLRLYSRSRSTQNSFVFGTFRATRRILEQRWTTLTSLWHAKVFSDEGRWRNEGTYPNSTIELLKTCWTPFAERCVILVLENYRLIDQYANGTFQKSCLPNSLTMHLYILRHLYNIQIDQRAHAHQKRLVTQTRINCLTMTYILRGKKCDFSTYVAMLTNTYSAYKTTWKACNMNHKNMSSPWSKKLAALDKVSSLELKSWNFFAISFGELGEFLRRMSSPWMATSCLASIQNAKTWRKKKKLFVHCTVWGEPFQDTLAGFTFPSRHTIVYSRNTHTLLRVFCDVSDVKNKVHFLSRAQYCLSR